MKIPKIVSTEGAYQIEFPSTATAEEIAFYREALKGIPGVQRVIQSELFLTLVIPAEQEFTIREIFRVLSLDPDYIAPEELQEQASEIAVRMIPDKLSRQWDLEEYFPPEIFREIGKLGLLATHIQKPYGLGLGNEHALRVVQAFSDRNPSLGMSLAAHFDLCGKHLDRLGTEAQRAAHLPGICDGSTPAFMAMSEPEAGSDLSRMACIAIWDPTINKFRANGEKTWITNGQIGEVGLVHMKTIDAEGKEGVSTFIIRRGMKGFSTGGKKLAMESMKASHTASLFFDDCVLDPEADVLGGSERIGKGWEGLQGGLTRERIVLLGGPLGIMQRAVRLAVAYSKFRRQGEGKLIGEHPQIAQILSKMIGTFEESQQYAYQIARNCDKRDSEVILPPGEAARGLNTLARNAIEVALMAVQVLGGMGLSKEHFAAQNVLDALLYPIGAGAEQIRAKVDGKQIFKEGYPAAGEFKFG